MSEQSIQVKDDKLIQTKDGEETEIGNAIIPIESRTNLDTKSIKVALEFVPDGKKKKIIKEVKRNEITKAGIGKLSEFGAYTWEENVEAYVKNIRSLLRKAKQTYEHSTVGLGTHNGKRIIKLDKGIGIDSMYDEGKYNLRPKGYYDEWLKVIKDEVLGRRYLEFALVAGFASLVINLISEEENMDTMMVNFSGTSSTGKTLATRLALSVWGLPDTMNKGLLRNWFGTDQGVISNLVNNFGVPIGIDDTSLSEADKDFTQTIYIIINGHTKVALNIDGTNRSTGQWKTFVISSSEESIIKNTDQNKKGINVRIFELKVDKITESAENAETIERVIMKNYGHAGVKFAEALIDVDSKDLVKRLHELRDELSDSIDGDSLSKRIALKLAVIQLTGELVREALHIDIDLATLKGTLIQMEQESMEDRNIEEKAYASMIEYFQTNLSKFFKDKDKPKNSGETLGKYYTNTNEEVTEIAIPENSFEKIMKRLGYSSSEAIIKSWKEKELLKCNKGKNTMTRVFVPGTPRSALYCIKIDQSINNVITIEKSEETVEALIEDTMY